MRVLVALAAHDGFEIEQMDVDAAYLQGWIDHDVYMTQPEGYVDPNNPHKVCKFNKGLYGLKQAGHIWYDTVSQYMVELGFTPIPADPCVYVRVDESGRLNVAVHVDDFAVAGLPHTIAIFKEQFGKRFPIKDLGPAKFIVGLQLERTFFGIHISQSTYIKDFVKTFSPDKCQHLIPIAPTDVQEIITHEAQGRVYPPADAHLYKQIVGKLLYATKTRPDIAYAVGFLGRFAAAPNKLHMKAAKYLLDYLKSRPNHGLYYPRGSGIARFHGYVDADHGGCKSRKSTGAFIIMLGDAPREGNSPISWCSRLQSLVTTSSTEAEYVATKDIAKEILWMRSLFESLGHLQIGPTHLY